MKQLHWFEHLFWMLGMMYCNLLKLNFKNGIDCYYWVIIHLSYKGEMTGYKSPPLLQRLKVIATATFGLLFSCFLIFLIIKLIQQLWLS